MTARKNGNKSVDQVTVDQTVQTIDPMVVLLVSKINEIDSSLDISHLNKDNISRNFKDISLIDVADNLTIDDLLALLAIAATNKKTKDQLISDIQKLTTNKKILTSLPDLTIAKLEEILENLQDPVLLNVKRAVSKDSISYTSFQPSKVLDSMIYIQGIKLDDQVDGDPVDAAIGSVFLRINNSSLSKDQNKQYFCEVFKGSVTLSDNAYQLGLTSKQIKTVANEIADLWCYETKVKKMRTKQTNDQKKQQDRDTMRSNMIAAIRDRNK